MEPARPTPRQLTEAERHGCTLALEARPAATPALHERAIAQTLIVPYHPRLLDVRGPRSAVALAALRNRATGITLGRHVFIRADAFDEDGCLPLELVVHEVVHVVQYYRDGTIGFLLRYLRDYLRNRARGMGDHEAYLNIPHEIEARHIAAHVHLQQPREEGLAEVIRFPLR